MDSQSEYCSGAYCNCINACEVFAQLNCPTSVLSVMEQKVLDLFLMTVDILQVVLFSNCAQLFRFFVCCVCIVAILVCCKVKCFIFNMLFVLSLYIVLFAH